jgi:methionyl-tRNA synthetase
LPKELAIHGFFTIDGKKMSKTLGNVINPNDLVKEYGADATRYLILSQFSFGNESDIRVEDFPKKYNADLVNGLGNLVNRITNMVEQYLAGDIGLQKFPEEKFLKVVKQDIEQLKFREALLVIWQPIHDLNEAIDHDRPWDLAKDSNKKKHLQKLLQNYITKLYSIAVALKPFMPDTSDEVLQIITAKKIIKPIEPLFKRK